MKLKNLLEKANYEKKHKCLTPGTVYSTEFHEDKIVITAKLPKDKDIEISKSKSEDLEVKLHYAIEKVLADLFQI